MVGKRMWGGFAPLVRHRHVWVRGVACRILGICFFKLGEEENGEGIFIFIILFLFLFFAFCCFALMLFSSFSCFLIFISL